MRSLTQLIRTIFHLFIGSYAQADKPRAKVCPRAKKAADRLQSAADL